MLESTLFASQTLWIWPLSWPIELSYQFWILQRWIWHPEVLINLLSLFQLFLFVANNMVTTSAKEFPCHKQQPQPQQQQVPSQQQQMPRRRSPPGFLREPELRAYCGQQMSTTAMLPKVAFASGWRRQQRHCRPRANEETIWERLPRLVIYFLKCSA